MSTATSDGPLGVVLFDSCGYPWHVVERQQGVPVVLEEWGSVIDLQPVTPRFLSSLFRLETWRHRFSDPRYWSYPITAAEYTARILACLSLDELVALQLAATDVRVREAVMLEIVRRPAGSAT